uniref:Uncharacterized protein n=1 Tax=Myotis myotis TaxID=51298 RepID=A0A7J7RUR9_MYOMY|nr:hypothetical protein mMyoMyo1_010142 [Myotis myotis]
MPESSGVVGPGERSRIPDQRASDEGISFLRTLLLPSQAPDPLDAGPSGLRPRGGRSGSKGVLRSHSKPRFPCLVKQPECVYQRACDFQGQCWVSGRREIIGIQHREKPAEPWAWCRSVCEQTVSGLPLPTPQCTPILSPANEGLTPDLSLGPDDISSHLFFSFLRYISIDFREEGRGREREREREKHQ